MRACDAAATARRESMVSGRSPWLRRTELIRHSVERAIRAEADPDLALNVVITGLASLGDCVSADRLQEDLAGEFFRLRLQDESHVRPEAIDPAQFPENTVLGRFVRMMQTELAGREGDARTIAEDALHWGVALLQGKELLS